MQLAQTAWVGLGSNRLDPRAQILAAMDALDALPTLAVSARSSLYLTPPWGIEDQAPFINAVLRLSTDLSAGELLDQLLELERAAGRDREREQRWGPRTLDLDLLVHGQEQLEHERLTVPHPRLAARAFVLVPMAEIDPLLNVPGLGRVDALLAALPSDSIAAISRLPAPDLRDLSCT